jgi:hypothetical protein
VNSKNRLQMITVTECGACVFLNPLLACKLLLTSRSEGMDLGEGMGLCGLDWSGSGQGQFESSFESSNKLSVSMKH